MDVLRIVDLVVGIVFVFLLVSTVCSAIREGIEAMLKTRAAYLERGIRELLDDHDGKGLTAQVFNHPQLFGLFLGKYKTEPLAKSLSLFARGKDLPSYIPAKNFALALLDIAARGAGTDGNSGPESPQMSVSELRRSVLHIENPGVRRMLLTALDTARGDLELARKNIEEWFDSSMDRVSGWYKRSTQWIVFVIAIVVTVGVNIDTLQLTNYLYHDQAARTAIAASAEEVAKKAPSAEEAAAALNRLELPIGWAEGQCPQSARSWFNRVLGWLITAFAATLGAPFWFDVLNQVMVIRSTVKPKQKSPEEASDDPQPKPPPSALPLSAVALAQNAGGTQLVPLLVTSSPTQSGQPDTAAGGSHGAAP